MIILAMGKMCFISYGMVYTYFFYIRMDMDHAHLGMKEGMFHNNLV